MAMPIIQLPDKPIERCQAVTDLIESVALMETGLSHIINAEGEKIQKVVKHDEDVEVPMEDLLSVNKSVEKMVSTITKLEIILQSKLELACCLGKDCLPKEDQQIQN